MNTTIKVQNLKCGGCANTITNKLSSLPNVTDVKIDVEESLVSFEYIDELTFESVIETLKISGYPQDGDENSFGTKAKSFVSCAIGRMS